MECAHDVLDAAEVDCGLASYGRIHLGEQRGGYVVIIYAPHVAGGGKACHVSDDSPSNGHHRIAPGEPPVQQRLENELRSGEGFAGLAAGDGEDTAAGASRKDGRGILRRHALIGYDQILASVAEKAPGIPEDTLSYGYAVFGAVATVSKSHQIFRLL